MSNKTFQIRKRSGRIVDFDQEKITQAVWKAAQSCGGTDYKMAEKVSKAVVKLLHKKFKSDDIPNVEDVQNIVEKVLIEEGHAQTAKAYILYREQHRQIRDIKNLLDADALIEDYLDQSDWRVKENSNMSYSLQGLNNHINTTIIARYWLNKIFTPAIRDAHSKGDFHIHDLGFLSAYCCGWDLKDLLMIGFGGASGKIESRPPKHLRTALGQAVNFFYTLQHEAAGAQAFSNFDTLLAPFIRYDKLTYEEVKQHLQEFLFNINVPTRVGCQTPFTNITLDLIVPSTYKDEAVIVGGKPQKEKYGDFQKEMNIFNRAFTEVMIEGDAKGRVFSFPIPTYNITKDFDWKNSEYDNVFEMTAKYGIPYFSNYINSDMRPEDARSMCCRLRLDNRELRKRGGGLFAANPLTGSIGVVTLNLPRLGYVSKTREEFFKNLKKLMDLAKDSLETKREVIERFTEEGLYPYSRHYLHSVKERFGQYWKNHFSTIGINGMNECLLNFKPIAQGIASEAGHKFAREVMDFMRETLMDYQNSTNNLYNLEATPAEGTAYRLARLDKKEFPDIIVANEEAYKEKKAQPYYTNSTHLPVNFSDDLFEVLKQQDDLQTRYTGGTVVHIFVGERLPSVEATKLLVRKIAENFHLPYFSITPTFSICPKHGYLAGEHFYCPKCDEEIGYNSASSASREDCLCEINKK